ncbi:hypothetical protein JN403_06770 [Pseudomonas sp. 15A4]|uniref:hypothetical protein n=1 Tax=Pseudomonas sp. 15A4 TaxID=2804761 RepID=UPI000F01547D|nr:hypothetical protein [Pseudomonas sp. 15A4]QSB20634.1 hypothetical protein JN403_06770 [Pseudomonas sp. 15A4]
MDIHYSVNGVSSLLTLPTRYVHECTPASLAELTASDFWRNRPTEAPTAMSLVHLADVDGQDLGMFEVQRDMRPIFTASPLREA